MCCHNITTWEFLCRLSETRHSKAKADKTLFQLVKLTKSISQNILQRPEQFQNNCNILIPLGLQNSIQAYKIH